MLIQAVRNAGGTKVEEKHDNSEELKETSLDKSDDIESTTPLQPPELEDSSSDEEDSKVNEYTTPLMSAEEAEPQSEEEKGPVEEEVELKGTSYNEKKLTREHKLRLLVTKGCVIAISCAVLVVCVVLASVLQHDYSSCDDAAEWVVEPSLLHSSLLLPTPTPVFIQPAS